LKHRRRILWPRKGIAIAVSLALVAPRAATAGAPQAEPPGLLEWAASSGPLERAEAELVLDFIATGSEEGRGAPPEGLLEFGEDGKARLSPLGRELLRKILLERRRTPGSPRPAAVGPGAQEGAEPGLKALGERAVSDPGGFFDGGARPGRADEARGQGALGRMKGAVLAMPLALYAGEATGASTWLHEEGHALAMRTLRDPAQVRVQVDGFENWRNLLEHPSWENLAGALGMRDAHGDGAAGYASYSGARETDLSRRLGERNTSAVISASGSVVQDLPAIAGFAAGYAIRKKHPVAGTALMTTSMAQHLMNSVYPWSAAAMSARDLAQAAARGHDWANVAQATGIHPALTALAYTAILPLEALVLHLGSKARERARGQGPAPLGLRKRLAGPIRGVREYYREGFRGDRVGTGLELGVLGMGGAAGIAAAAEAAGQTAGPALGALVPGLGLVLEANSAYRLKKALRDPGLDRIEKTLVAAQHASGMAAAAGLLLPTPPVLTLAGVAGSLGALGARMAYRGWKTRGRSPPR